MRAPLGWARVDIRASEGAVARIPRSRILSASGRLLQRAFPRGFNPEGPQAGPSGLVDSGGEESRARLQRASTNFFAESPRERDLGWALPQLFLARSPQRRPERPLPPLPTRPRVDFPISLGVAILNTIPIGGEAVQLNTGHR